MSELQVQVEMPSNIVRKLTIKVPAKLVNQRFERGLAEVQRTAKLKGFRPGQAPISIIKQYYGEDVRHRVFHSIIDESFQEAVREHKLKAIGRPTIDTPNNKTGAGEHDHTLKENEDLTFTATVEVLPEIQVKGYTGVSLTKEKIDVTDDDVEKVVTNLLDSQAQLVPASSGLAAADGSNASRPVRKKDYTDISFHAGIVTPNGIEEKAGMKGERMLEVGSDQLIPGFEDNLVGMRKGETKTFRVQFPKDFYEKDMAGQEAEFTVTINEVKEKNLPALDDEFAKTVGYESVSDLRIKAKEFVLRERTNEVDGKLRSDLIADLIEKNKFDVPAALIESQTRALAQDWAGELKKQGVDETTIQQALMGEIESLKKRAENQVRASLLLEAVAKKENIEISADDFKAELKKNAEGMKVEISKLEEFYSKNPGRQDDMMFRLRQDRTLKFLLDKAKIKAKS